MKKLIFVAVLGFITLSVYAAEPYESSTQPGYISESSVSQPGVYDSDKDNEENEDSKVKLLDKYKLLVKKYKSLQSQNQNDLKIDSILIKIKELRNDPDMTNTLLQVILAFLRSEEQLKYLPEIPLRKRMEKIN
ncbi:MAG: hypothetical protein P4L22_00875 [Candidatus Babeliales bacterium]|nr:hypothetical protein [Candidatus Babeliales bacterium]